ncbi:MAG: polyprenol phosphomannose-dependent alpha 1,6 mannosyltransferase MptB [Acidimicrobiales bacterium]
MSTAKREQPAKRRSALGRYLSSAHEAVTALWCRGEALVAPFRDPVVEPSPYAPGDPVFRRRLAQSAVTGFVGSTAIFWGASQQYSPFSETSAAAGTPAWFFGLRPQPLVFNQTPAPGHSFYLSLVAFYGGMVLLMRAWIRLGRLAREHPGMPVRIYAYVMVAWTLPMLFVAPMLSKDAYSYVAQGEMMSRNISPYRFGPAVLGISANSYTILSDKLWWYTTSPYGPGFLGLAGLIQALVNHSELGAIVMFRVVALAGVGLFAVFIPRLARSFGRDPSTAFAYAVMNPIVLIHLIGGEHNDALMLGLLVAGLALAREHHPVIGTVLVALAVLVKVPAILGVVYIGWDWLGPGVDWRQRLKPLAAAGAIALAVMAAVSEAVGIGWGWVAGLTNPDTVRSYLDPATAIGLGLAKLVGAVGLGDHSHLILTLARGSGAVVAGAIGVWLLWRSKGGASSMRAIGLTMLFVVLLGPVMQPWYLAWGVVLLGPVAEGRLRGALVWLTVIVTFLGVGDAKYFVLELGKANPVIFGVASIAMLVVLLAPFVPRARRGIPVWQHRRSSGTGRRREEVSAGL